MPSFFSSSYWLLVGGGGTAFLSAVALTPLVVRLARRQGWIDRPRAERWHKKPTALMGGIAIFAAFTLAFALGEVALASALPWTLWAGGALMFAVGLADNLRGLSPTVKLIAQVGAALLLLYAGYAFGKGGPFWLSVPLTFLWVIGITNAVNLLDGMDGLAAGIVVIASAVLAAYALLVGSGATAWGIAAVAGAAAGFLLFNFKPASVFMGDCGSLFLGYVIAAFATVVQGQIAGPSGLAVYLVSAAVLAVPIFDTTLVMVARVFSGRPITQGGTDHSSHRLVKLGLPERRAVLTLYAISIVFGGLALFFHVAEVRLFYAMVVFLGVALVVFGLHLGNTNVYRRPRESAVGGDGAGGHAAVSHASVAANGVKKNGTRANGSAANGIAGGGAAEGGEAAPRQHTLLQQSVAFLQTFMGRRWKPVVQLLTDLLLVAAAFVLAHSLRFENGLGPQRELFLMNALPGVVALKLVVFWAARLYRGLWEHAGTPELVRVVEAATGASALCYVGLIPFYGMTFLSEATFVIDWMIVTIAVIGVRFAFRGLRQYFLSKEQCDGRRVLLYGAGESGQLTLRGLRQRADLDMAPVGFLDDNFQKQGLTAQGVSVLGTFDHLERVCREHRVEEVLITAFSMTAARKRAIVGRCAEIEVSCRVFNLALRPVYAENGAHAEHTNGASLPHAEPA